MLVHRLLKRMLVHRIITKSDRGKWFMAMSAWFLRTFDYNHYIIKINHRDKQTLWSKRHLWYGVLYYTSSTLHETVCVWFWSCSTLTSITCHYMMKSVTGEKFTNIYSETGYFYMLSVWIWGHTFWQQVAAHDIVVVYRCRPCIVKTLESWDHSRTDLGSACSVYD